MTLAHVCIAVQTVEGDASNGQWCAREGGWGARTVRIATRAVQIKFAICKCTVYRHHFVHQLKELGVGGTRLLQAEIQRVLHQLLAANRFRERAVRERDEAAGCNLLVPRSRTTGRTLRYG